MAEIIESDLHYSNPSIDQEPGEKSLTLEELRSELLSDERMRFIKDAIRVWGSGIYKYGITHHDQAFRDFSDLVSSVHNLEPDKFHSILEENNINVNDIAENVKKEIQRLRDEDQLSPVRLVQLHRYNQAFPDKRQIVSFDEGTDQYNQLTQELEKTKLEEPVQYWQTLAALRDVAFHSVAKFGLDQPELFEEGQHLIDELAHENNIDSLLEIANALHSLFPDQELHLPEDIEEATIKTVSGKRPFNPYAITKPLREVANLQSLYLPVKRNRLSDIGVPFEGPTA